MKKQNDFRKEWKSDTVNEFENEYKKKITIAEKMQYVLSVLDDFWYIEEFNETTGGPGLDLEAYTERC